MVPETFSTPITNETNFFHFANFAPKTEHIENLHYIWLETDPTEIPYLPAYNCFSRNP